MFPSPLGDPYIQMHNYEELIALCKVSVTSRRSLYSNIKKARRLRRSVTSFRPLSEILIFKFRNRVAYTSGVYGFPSPLGDPYIQITTIYFDMDGTIAFPSPLGDPYIQIGLLQLKKIQAQRFRPPRGNPYIQMNDSTIRYINPRFRPLAEILISKSRRSSTRRSRMGIRPLSEILIFK